MKRFSFDVFYKTVLHGDYGSKGLVTVGMSWLDYVPLVNTALIPIGMVAISGLRKLREVDLANIANKFDALILELREVRGQIAALELRVARLEGIIMKAAGVHKGD